MAAGRGGAGEDARTLLRSRRCGALATALAGADAWPYASLVSVACDPYGHPILLLSQLSDHTRNLAADPRASLLLEAASLRANPQSGPRLTLLGRIAADATPLLRRRFLALHPGAALYVDFADFAIFRMQVERAHWVGGFARARWLPADALLAEPAAAQAVAEAEPSVLAHMNEEHADAVALYAERLLGRSGEGWRMVAVDCFGCDLARGARAFARLPFPRPATDAATLRALLIELAQLARRTQAG